MCIKISSLEYHILEYEDYFVGLKVFKINKNGKFLGSSTFKEYIYKFQKFEKGLIAPPDSTIQPVYYEILTKKAKEGYFGLLQIQRRLLLGYHIYKFSKNVSLENYYRQFSPIEPNEIVLPILFKPEWIQISGHEDFVSEMFVIPNKETYLEVCSYHNVKPDKDLSKLLNTLTSKIKTEGD
jgi:hypothetical protein